MEAAAQTCRTRFGAFDVDLRSGELHKYGIRLKLQDQPFQVLALLLEHPGDLVTREELRQKLWPADTFVDFDTGLNSAIKKLRDVLGDSAGEPRYIETLPRRGYRFIARVGNGPQPAPPAGEQSQLAPTLPAEEPVSKETRTAESAAARRAIAPRRRRIQIGLAAMAALVLLVFGLNLGGWRDRLLGRPAPESIRSIAVLPLENLSGDPADEYFADGMTEELITELSRIGGFKKVIPRTSIIRYKTVKKPLKEIGRELGVAGLVEGSVLRAGSRVRITVKLVEAAGERILWVESYERDLRGVLALQREVAQSIARRFDVAITGRERGSLVAARAVAPEVFESYLKGRHALHNRARVKPEVAIQHFQDAIARDATFAPAYAGLATAHSATSGVFFAVSSPPEARAKATAAARKALELDPNLAEAHVVLADALAGEWHWAEAEAEYKQALALNPNDADAHVRYSQWLLQQGRIEDALGWARRGRELDPLAITGGLRLGWTLFHARRYDEAIRELRIVLAVEPENPGALWFLGFALIEAGRLDEAIQALEKAASVSDRNSAVLGVLVRAYARAGRRREALQVLDELHRRRQTRYVPAAALLHAYLELGDHEQAFAWLERAFQERSIVMQLLKVHPSFDPLRSDPRFEGYLRRVGLAP